MYIPIPRLGARLIRSITHGIGHVQGSDCSSHYACCRRGSLLAKLTQACVQKCILVAVVMAVQFNVRASFTVS